MMEFMKHIRTIPLSISLLCLSGCFYNDIRIDILNGENYTTIHTEFVSYTGDFINNEFIIDRSGFTAEKVEKLISDFSKIEADCKSFPAVQDFTIFKEPWRHEGSEKYFKSQITFKLADASTRKELENLADCILLSTGYIASFDRNELKDNNVSGLFVAGFSRNGNSEPVYDVGALKKAGVFGLGEVCISKIFNNENLSNAEDSNKICDKLSIYEETTFVKFNN